MSSYVMLPGLISAGLANLLSKQRQRKKQECRTHAIHTTMIRKSILRKFIPRKSVRHRVNNVVHPDTNPEP